MDPVSDLFWEAVEAANDFEGCGPSCTCDVCGGSLCCDDCTCSDREYEEHVSWEQHRAEVAEDLLTSVWYAAHHAHADGVCDDSCDDLARFIVHVTFGSPSA